MNEPNEGKLETNEGGQPTQTLPVETQPSQGDLTKMQARIDELDRAYRALQSEKDRGVKKVAADVERINKALRLKEKGLDEDEIMHRLKVDELYERGTVSEPVAPQPVATVKQDTYLVEAMSIVGDAGLDPTDAEVVKLMVAKAPAVDYYKLANRKLKAPAPEGAGAPPMRPEGVPQKDLDALANSYVKEINQLRGNKAAILAKKDEYEKKGLDTSRIDPLRR
jgi:hypothetical protein